MKSKRLYIVRKLAAVHLAVLLGWALGATAASENQTFITVGTGGFNGLYSKTGRRICKLINSARAQHGLLCSVESTAESVYNLNTIRAGGFEIGLAQSDWQHHAYQGTGPFEEAGPFKALRTVFSLYPEAFTVVARADVGIKHFSDLEGKRVNIGNRGSGHRATIEAVLAALDWDTSDFAVASELESGEQSKALCDNKIDAMILTVGHPNQSVLDATTACDSVIVEVSGPGIDKLVVGIPYYRRVAIPGGMYRNNPVDINTFGVDATVVSSLATDEETVYNVVRAVFEQFDDFKRQRPVLANLTKAYMVKDGLSAPLHDGATRYFKEVGLLNQADSRRDRPTNRSGNK